MIALIERTMSPSTRSPSVPTESVHAGVDQVQQDRWSGRPLNEPTSEVSETYDENRFLVRLIAVMAVLLLTPAVLVFGVLIVSPDFFAFDITPDKDFTNWRPGQHPD
ncbi:hypothetical protein [Rhodopirellula halodulae]|uniref:hypothetical protein n=1 Tax=Rhodopirellula halodulae TaxID=2894198 RepID=UPI001E3A8097|nr:hypothetical protein [Rhodopirellula sp. JC737]MCC9658697.1 hypothetical protein [Rhodopirellula sp. JC737]